jgi:hypothetical protein
MFNEVHKCCPICKSTCTVQISQIVDGFGNFHLDFPSTMEELTDSERDSLSQKLEDLTFYCKTHGAIDAGAPLPEE